MTYTAKRKVCYYYDPSIGTFYYGEGHVMKPYRIRMAYHLSVAYGLHNRMDVLTPPRAGEKDLTRFHSDDYINFLKNITPTNVPEHFEEYLKYFTPHDCPAFDNLYDFCQIAAGGSLAAAQRLNTGESSIGINWAGGLHHGQPSNASGFCYINDCVLAILELLKVHNRVLYVDIDVHHGDGVEKAFLTTNRVMTASFHMFGKGFFPKTGDIIDVGLGEGKYYSLNVPLLPGIDDINYRKIFRKVMTKVMDWYKPGAVVLQCGADSLSGDRLGEFNLSLEGHGQCVDFFKQYDVPLLLLGGGGYKMTNVARCWTYETSRALGVTIPDEIPYNDNYEFYAPDYRLHISTHNLENRNNSSYINKIEQEIFENLRQLPHAPSTPFQDTPGQFPLGQHLPDDDGDNNDPDIRPNSPMTDQ